MMPLTHPQLTRWISTHCCDPMLTSRMERAVMASFLSFLVPPIMTNFSLQLLFQLNCYPFGHASCPDSVSNANKRSHCHPLLRCCMEKAVRVSSLLIDIPPFNTFLHSFSFQFNCCPIGRASHPPSVNQGNKGPPPPSPPASCMEKVVMVSFPLVFNFSPPFQFFLTSFFSVIQSAASAALPQSNKGTRARHHHLCPQGVWRRLW